MNKPAYFMFESLPDSVRASLKIRSNSRLDCTKAFNPYEYKGLEPITKANGMIYLYITTAKDIVQALAKRQAEFLLTDGKLNFTSMYFEDIDNPSFAYGYPNPNRLLSNRVENPFYTFKGDAYLFITNANLSKVELLVFPGSRHLINGYYHSLTDGALDELLKEAREQATAFFDYGLYNKPI
jgi:hypothetical protein